LIKDYCSSMVWLLSNWQILSNGTCIPICSTHNFCVWKIQLKNVLTGRRFLWLSYLKNSSFLSPKQVFCSSEAQLLHPVPRQGQGPSDMSAGNGEELLWIREMGLGYKWAVHGRRQTKACLTLFLREIFQNEKSHKKSECMKIILNNVYDE